MAMSDVAALLAVSGLAEDELAPFCAVAAAVLDGRHGSAHRQAMRLWRGGHRQRFWTPEVLRLVLYAGPRAPLDDTMTTPEDVRMVEDALGLVEDGPAHRAWCRELERANVGIRKRGPSWVIGHLPLLVRAIR